MPHVRSLKQDKPSKQEKQKKNHTVAKISAVGEMIPTHNTAYLTNVIPLNSHNSLKKSVHHTHKSNHIIKNVKDNDNKGYKNSSGRLYLKI